MRTDEGAHLAAAKALTETAAFLKAQGRVQALAPDYARFVTTEVVDAARK